MLAGIHFSRLVMCVVEVAGVSSRLTPSFKETPTLTRPTPPPVICRRCAPTPRPPWDYLVQPGIQFGRVVMCLVEVLGVSTRLTAFFSTFASQCTASHSQACDYGSRDLTGGARVLSNSPGTIYCTRESGFTALSCLSWKWQA